MDFKFKKRYGQNFLKDDKVIDDIVDSALIDKDTLVIEVGPGSGILTKKLCLKAGYVRCFEIDSSLKPILDSNLKGIDNVLVTYEDFLNYDLSKIDISGFSKVYLVSNLPYYITTPIVMKVLQASFIDKLVIMIQKEVADRFMAKPKSRSYGSLTVFLSYYFDISKVREVNRNLFYPVPNVDSMVIKLERKKNLLYLKDKDLFFKLVRDCFTHKRKNLKNNLKEYDLDRIESLLNERGYSLSNRAEELPLDVFVFLTNSLKN